MILIQPYVTDTYILYLPSEKYEILLYHFFFNQFLEKDMTIIVTKTMKY